MRQEHWFAVQAMGSKVDDACLRLRRVGFEIWRPLIQKRRARRHSSGQLARRGLKPVAQQAPMITIRPWGSYFLLRCPFDGGIFREVEMAPEVWGFVRIPGQEPQPIADSYVAFLREFRPDPPEKSWQEIFVKGARVAIKDGPFAGQNATIAKVDERGILEVDLQIMGGACRTIVEVAHVAFAGAAAMPPKGRKTFLGAGSNSDAGRIAP